MSRKRLTVVGDASTSTLEADSKGEEAVVVPSKQRFWIGAPGFTIERPLRKYTISSPVSFPGYQLSNAAPHCTNRVRVVFWSKQDDLESLATVYCLLRRLNATFGALLQPKEFEICNPSNTFLSAFNSKPPD